MGYGDPMIPLLLTILQATPPKPEAELQTTFWVLILGVAAAAIFLWLIFSRFQRPP